MNGADSVASFIFYLKKKSGGEKAMNEIKTKAVAIICIAVIIIYTVIFKVLNKYSTSMAVAFTVVTIMALFIFGLYLEMEVIM